MPAPVRTVKENNTLVKLPSGNSYSREDIVTIIEEFVDCDNLAAIVAVLGTLTNEELVAALATVEGITNEELAAVITAIGTLTNEQLAAVVTAIGALTNEELAVVTTVNNGGDTASRPAEPVLYQSYFDATLGKPIWWNGTGWVDAAGANPDD